MATPKTVTWSIEPHTRAKHEILRRYLGAWFPILASGHGRIVYVDGFCGPGRYENSEPGSPLIAILEALKHEERLKNKQVTFWFMDQDADRVSCLKEEIVKVPRPNNFHCHVQHSSFEIEFTSMLDLLDANSKELAPTFAFIDPFGIKGVPYSLVRRLLQKRSTEVLVYFAEDAVNRWLAHPDSKIRQNIANLFGTDKVFSVSNQPNRAMALRLLYQEQLAECAKFVRYFEMRNSRDRTIYCLFFASNHPLGHKKMKEAFWAVDPTYGFQFSDATSPGQLVMFENDPSEDLSLTLGHVFSGNTTNVETVLRYVDDCTPYLERHGKASLRALETTGKLKVSTTKPNGTKRKGMTFPKELEVVFL